VGKKVSQRGGGPNASEVFLHGVTRHSEGDPSVQGEDKSSGSCFIQVGRMLPTARAETEKERREKETFLFAGGILNWRMSGGFRRSEGKGGNFMRSGCRKKEGGGSSLKASQKGGGKPDYFPVVVQRELEGGKHRRKREKGALLHGIRRGKEQAAGGYRGWSRLLKRGTPSALRGKIIRPSKGLRRRHRKARGTSPCGREPTRKELGGGDARTKRARAA